MFKALSAFSLALFLAVGGTAVAQVPGWPALTWGMDADDIARAVPEAVPLPSPWDFGPLEAHYLVPETDVGGTPFRVLLQTDRETGTLRQVLFENRRQVGSPKAIEGVIGALQTVLGPPDAVCRGTRGPEARHVELLWRTEDAVVHAGFLDFLTTGVITRDPSADIDPLKTWREQRVLNWRFLPRRITIRYHAAEDADLDPECRVVELQDATVEKGKTSPISPAPPS